MPTLTPLRYLMQELKISSADWQSLSEKDREDLKQWAMDEQKELDL